MRLGIFFKRNAVLARLFHLSLALRICRCTLRRNGLLLGSVLGGLAADRPTGTALLRTLQSQLGGLVVILVASVLPVFQTHGRVPRLLHFKEHFPPRPVFLRPVVVEAVNHLVVILVAKRLALFHESLLTKWQRFLQALTTALLPRPGDSLTIKTGIALASNDR